MTTTHEERPVTTTTQHAGGVPAAQTPEPVIEMRDISITFGSVRALDGVSLRLLPGEVHALMGENGAGKSTLIKALTGVYTIDSGTIVVGGEEHRFATPAAAQAAGISTVYQEVNLCGNLSVAENIFIGRAPRRWGRIDWKAVNRRAAEALRRLDVDIDVRQPLGSYPVAIQQMVAIARALDISARVLILSASGEQPDVLAAVKAGATGYLVKSASREELLAAVRRVAAGDTVFTPGLAGLVLGEFRRMADGPSEPEGDGLTERETEILKMVAKGLSYKQIAERLVISHRTVQNHVQNTLRKLQIHNRVQLTRYAIEQGLDADEDE